MGKPIDKKGKNCYNIIYRSRRGVKRGGTRKKGNEKTERKKEKMDRENGGER